MPVEFIGMIGVKPEGDATVHVIGGDIDPGWIGRFSRAHEQAGFDRVLVGYTSTSAEGFAVAQLRRLADRATQLSHRPSPGLRHADTGRAHGGHARPSDRRARRAAHHHRRHRQRARARRRPARQGHAVPPHRRVRRSHAPDVDRRPSVRLRGAALPAQPGVVGREAAPEAGDPDLLRRRLRPRDRGQRQARRRLCALGRAAGRGERAHRRRAGAGGGLRSPPAHQRLVPSDPRRRPRPRRGSGRARILARVLETRRRCVGEARRSAAGRRRASAASISRGRARSTTSGCGRRSPRRRAAPATRPRWSARPSRSPTRCSTITIWASPRS